VLALMALMALMALKGIVGKFLFFYGWLAREGNVQSIHRAAAAGLCLSGYWRGGGLVLKRNLPAKSQFHHNSVSGISYWDY